MNAKNKLNQHIYPLTIIFLIIFLIFPQSGYTRKRKIDIETIPPSSPSISYHSKTKFARFMTSKEGGAIRQRAAVLPEFGSNESAARYYLSDNSYGRLLGIKDQEHELRFILQETISQSNKDIYRNRSFVRFQQVYQGIPVFGGEIVVELSAGKDLMVINGKFVPGIDRSTIPQLLPEEAIKTAIQAVGAAHEGLNANNFITSIPELYVYNPIIIGTGAQMNHLAFRIEVTSSNQNLPVKDIVLIDADLNIVLLHYNQYESPVSAPQLFHYETSGAIMESFSTIRRAIADFNAGKTSSIALQMLNNPLAFDQPDHKKSVFYQCAVTYKENGTKVNCGVANKAAGLIARGGTFNGMTITPMGFDILTDLLNEAAHLLTHSSTYGDLYDILLQSCRNLGITDYEPVYNALEAVKMKRPECVEVVRGEGGKINPCNFGLPVNYFFDDIESGNINWEIITFIGEPAWSVPQTSSSIKLKKPYATSGTGNIWGFGQPGKSDSVLMMNKDIILADNAFLHFKHSYNFDEFSYDGGILEYSLDSGTTWKPVKNEPTDGYAFFQGNDDTQKIGYNGVIASNVGNVLEGNAAFTGKSNGYIDCRVNLNNLHGKSFRFRFRIATDDDEYSSSFGWFIDDVRIYQCDDCSAMQTICENDVTIESVNNGQWDNSNTWLGNRIPGDNDIVKINAGHRVVLDSPIKIKGFCNDGDIKSVQQKNISIEAKTFISNNGTIWGADGLDGDGALHAHHSGSSGSDIVLNAPNICNNENGNIQAGRGGHDITYDSFVCYRRSGCRITARGGDGGNILISGEYVTNSGKIGPDLNPIPANFDSYRGTIVLPGENIDGGNGGNAQNWDGVYGYEGVATWNDGHAFGGNGGNTYLSATNTLQNKSSGEIGSGNGGWASVRYRNVFSRIPGKGGDLLFNAPNTINNGELHGGGPGSTIWWDPTMVIADENAILHGAETIHIFGGDHWILDLNQLSPGAISAQHVHIALGYDSSVNFQGSASNIFQTDHPVTIAADTIIVDHGAVRTRSHGILRSSDLRAITGSDPLVDTSEIFYGFSLIAKPRYLSGEKNSTLSTTLRVLNNGPVFDSYSLVIQSMKNWDITISSNPKNSEEILIDIPPMSSKEFSLEIKLPENAGENNTIMVSATSVSAPEKTVNTRLNVSVLPGMANFSATMVNPDNPLSYDFTADTVADDINIQTWEWNFGDGNTSTEQNPTHTYPNTGNYIVTLQATDTNQNSERIVRQVTVKKSKILLLAADEIKETQHILADTGMFNLSDIDIMERPSSICLEDLMPYSSILVWTNYPFSDPVNIGNVLKEYVDAGGGLVIASYSNSDVNNSDADSRRLAGGILEPNYSPFSGGSESIFSGILDMDSITDPEHYLFNNIDQSPEYWTNHYYVNPQLNTNAILLAKDTDNNNLVAINPMGNIIGISIYPEKLIYANDTCKRLFANALTYVAGESSHLSVTPDQYVVSASKGSQSFNIDNMGESSMKWFAHTDCQWLIINDPLSGMDAGEITVVYDFNDQNDSRTGHIMITSVGAIDSPKVLTITQLGNQLPTLSHINDQIIDEDTSANISFVVNDEETIGEKLLVSAVSSNATLVKNSQVFISATGNERNLTINPTANQYGTAQITISVSDGNRRTEQQFQLTVMPVNDPPFFVKGGHVKFLRGTVQKQSIPQWAIQISPGPNETDQSVIFYLDTDEKYLFSELPQVLPDGTLYYTPQADFFGIATITIFARDNGGTANGGTDESIRKTFTIESIPELPDFSRGSDIEVLEDSGSHVFNNWATDIDPGTNDPEPNVLFVCQTEQSELFAEQPSINPQGSLRFKGSPDAYGTAIIEAYLKDKNRDNAISATKKFSIQIIPVNDAPNFVATDISVLEDSGSHVFRNWASNITAGAFETDQSIEFKVNTMNPELFDMNKTPSISSDGTLTFTPAPDMNGSTSIHVSAQDNGGTSHNGINVSQTQIFTITIMPVNDAPSFVKGKDQLILEDAPKQIIPGWANQISSGTNENQQQVFLVTTDNDNLFTEKPEILSNGTLTYKLSPDANGKSIISVCLMDNAGTANDGQDKSDIQQFLITVIPVNDRPQFTGGPNQVIFDDAPKTISNWASNITPGPKEIEQTAVFILTIDNDRFFAVPPSISNDGILSFTPQPGQYGISTITAYLKDNGSTANDGKNVSEPYTFTISRTTPPSEAIISLSKTWNLISIPVIPESNDLTRLIPDALTAFAYDAQNGGYTEVYHLIPGNGYWIELAEEETITITGKPFVSYSRTFEPGWHMIGAIATNGNIREDTPGCVEVMYQYNNGSYEMVEKMLPGFGYWVNILEECVIYVE
jgi:PKD repeat protein